MLIVISFGVSLRRIVPMWLHSICAWLHILAGEGTLAIPIIAGILAGAISSKACNSPADLVSPGSQMSFRLSRISLCVGAAAMLSSSLTAVLNPCDSHRDCRCFKSRGWGRQVLLGGGQPGYSDSFVRGSMQPPTGPTWFEMNCFTEEQVSWFGIIQNIKKNLEKKKHTQQWCLNARNNNNGTIHIYYRRIQYNNNTIQNIQNISKHIFLSDESIRPAPHCPRRHVAPPVDHSPPQRSTRFFLSSPWPEMFVQRLIQNVETCWNMLMIHQQLKHRVN